MNFLPPKAKQVIVASAPQLAALSVGGIFGYPNVILEQFKSNDSSIHVDFDMASWIGSVHGLAGLPSILMPTVMQWKGRKFAFIICCLLILIGWILTYISTSITTIIIGESFHGIGSSSIITVSFFTISEMVDPRFRMISMTFYVINQCTGTALVCIMGRFIHWKTVSLLISIPIVIALLIGCIWPESPSWLAWKGEFDKCEEAFVWLRGTDEDSRKELNALIHAKKHMDYVNLNHKELNKLYLKDLWQKIKRRDFYLPCFQMFVCMCLFYCSGTEVFMVYAMEMIRKATQNESAAFYGMIAIDLILIFGTLASALFMKMFKNKTILLCSGGATAVCLFFATLVTYLQSVGSLSKDSLLCLYCLIGSMIACSSGTISLSFTVGAELVPVKHRDLGGALYVVLTCLLHFVSLKVSPYMMLYLDLWGTFLIFTLNAFFCLWYIFKYVPETKNKTLQEIEDYYNYGYFIDTCKSGGADVTTPLANVQNE